MACFFIFILLAFDTSAAADVRVDSWNTELRIARTGEVTITEELTLFFASSPKSSSIAHMIPGKRGFLDPKAPSVAVEALLGFIDSKPTSLEISEVGKLKKITLHQSHDLSPGSHSFVFQYKTRDLIVRGEKEDTLIWPVAQRSKGPIRSFQVKIVPPEYYEPKNIQLRRMEFIKGALVTTVPEVSVASDFVTVSGTPVVEQQSSYIFVGLTAGFIRD